MDDSSFVFDAPIFTVVSLVHPSPDFS